MRADDLPALGAHVVVRRDPSRSVVIRVLRAHLETFLDRFTDEHGGRSLPAYVERELRAVIACGDVAHGFCRVRCPCCTLDLLVAFSCKSRGFCPSCGGRWMAELAAHLVDGVIPDVPTRQWVLPMPIALRLHLAADPDLCRDVASAFIDTGTATEIEHELRRERRERVERSPPVAPLELAPVFVSEAHASRDHANLPSSAGCARR